jgi:hypothetical protein
LSVLFQVFGEQTVASGATIARPRMAADVGERSQLARLQGVEQNGFGHLETPAHHPAGAMITGS